MDIDVSALKALVREKELSYDLLVSTLEQALLLAYQRTEGSMPEARVEVDRKTGHVTVWARELPAEDGTRGREYDDTPDGFGRVAATTARNVILQRLREAEDDVTFGEFVGTDGRRECRALLTPADALGTRGRIWPRSRGAKP